MASITSTACASTPTITPITGSEGRGPVEPGQEGRDGDLPPPRPWRERRATPTRLLREGPAPASPSILHLSDGMEQVRYPSDELSLLAIVARPPRTPVTADTPLEKLPAILLLHDGFALDDDTLDVARGFVAEGFVVMMPASRGENGNPGRFELWRGELDDAKAATRWLAADPEVDVDRLYAFGHAEGGGLATLLALEADVPFRAIASSNGVYGTGVFARLARQDPRTVPFDLADIDETTVRVLVPNAHEIEQRLILYVAKEDRLSRQAASLARDRASAAGKGLEVVELEGDPQVAGRAAVARFRDLVMKEAFGAPLARR